MNKTAYFFSILCLFTILLAGKTGFTAAPLLLPHGDFNYLERVGDKIIPFTWRAERSESNIMISVFEKSKAFLNYCSDNGDTHKWHINVEGKHNIQAERIGNTLHIEGTRFGEEFKDKVKIDNRPWYQPLSFSLRNFLNSDKEKTSFWVIRADSIEVIALTAKKLGLEKLTTAGKETLTQKIEIRAEGFFSSFWSAKYWYRKSDNLFVRYESVHGLPGTATTIVELIESPQS